MPHRFRSTLKYRTPLRHQQSSSSSSTTFNDRNTPASTGVQFERFTWYFSLAWKPFVRDPFGRHVARIFCLYFTFNLFLYTILKRKHTIEFHASEFLDCFVCTQVTKSIEFNKQNKRKKKTVNYYIVARDYVLFRHQFG